MDKKQTTADGDRRTVDGQRQTVDGQPSSILVTPYSLLTDHISSFITHHSSLITKKVLLFLTLRTFSATGGIEKVCRVAGKAFQEISIANGGSFTLLSLHDNQAEQTEPYINSENFFGCAGKKIKFVWRSFWKGIRARQVVLSHINLSLPGLLILFFAPKTKVILIAHGIEVWGRKLTRTQKLLLKKVDLIAAVSSYTKNRLIDEFGLDNVKVIHDPLDPFLPSEIDHLPDVRQQYGFENDDFILLTVTRLAFTEVKKNYDNIIRVMGQLQKDISNIKYLFVGKYDEAEKNRLEQIAKANGVGDRLVFTGFVADSQLPNYYDAADVYVLPSKKEGFGLTFIEAAYYGLPVIAGNKDGSVDALLQGKLGILIDPDSEAALQEAILKIYKNRNLFTNQRELVVQHFSFGEYKRKWRELVSGA